MRLRLILKDHENNGRFDFIPQFLKSNWEIISVDFKNSKSVIHAFQKADAVISMEWTDQYPEAPNLKLLQLQGAGTESVDLSAVPRSAFVCNVYEHEIGISEYVLAGMLQWVTKIKDHDDALRKNIWEGSFLSGPPHEELLGKTLGIIGYGRIGKAVAYRAKAFGMNIITLNRNLPKDNSLIATVTPLEELDLVLRQSDFLLLSIPLNQETNNIISYKELDIMKHDSVIINVGRGQLIKEDALFNACRNKQIGGAIIDTWYMYPEQSLQKQKPSDFDFHLLNNVIMTPHASAWTKNLIRRRCKEIACNLDSIFNKKKPANIVRLPI